MNSDNSDNSGNLDELLPPWWWLHIEWVEVR